LAYLVNNYTRFWGFAKGSSLWGVGDSWTRNLNQKGKNDYVNISSIPDEELWPTLYRQLRRFETYSYNKYRLTDLNWRMHKSISYNKIVSINGTCTECGSLISSKLMFNPIGQFVHCKNCHIINYVNYYVGDSFKEHCHYIKSILQDSDRILLVGLNKNVIRYDLFGMDYDNSVLGIIDPVDLSKYYPYSKNELDSSTINDIAPDCFFITDDPVGNAELKIKIYCARNMISVPRIVHVLPDSMRRTYSVVRNVELLKSYYASMVTYTIVSNYLLFIYHLISQFDVDKSSVSRKIIKTLLPYKYRKHLLHLIRILFRSNIESSSK